MLNASKISTYSLSKNKNLFFDSTTLATRQPKEYCLYAR